MVSPALPLLQSARAGGVFFLHGEDQFQKEETVRALVDHCVDPETRDFNLDQLRGSETDVEAVARILATPPMMADLRVVVVREVEALVTSAPFRTLLGKLVEAPPPGLTTILEATIPQKSKAKVYRTLMDSCQSLEFPAVSQDDVPGWLMSRAREHHGREFEPDAARALAAAVGNELGVLARELEKLSGMTDEGGSITLAEVEAAGTHLPRQDRWKWFDLIGEKRFEAALTGLPVLLQQGESGVGLAIGLGTHLLRLGILVEHGAAALEKVLPPRQRWLARRLQGQARRWSGAEIAAALGALRRTDELLKSSPMSDAHLVEQWILVIMTRAQAAA